MLQMAGSEKLHRREKPSRERQQWAVSALCRV